MLIIGFCFTVDMSAQRWLRNVMSVEYENIVKNLENKR